MGNAMTDDATKLPWCPLDGHPFVWHREAEYPQLAFLRCTGCGREISGKGDDDCESNLRKHVRAELARQALELRAHSPEAHFAEDGVRSIAMSINAAHHHVLEHYDWLGTNPLRLPGEDK